MLIYSMNTSLDGFINDRRGAFDWSVPGADQFLAHVEQTQELGAFLLGRRLYETMLVWDTDPSLRATEAEAAFADAWCAIPKIVFSRTLDSVQGNARLARGPLAEEVEAVRQSTDKDVGIGGPTLAAEAVDLDLVDELRIFRHPIVVGGGTPFLPPVSDALQFRLVETRSFDSAVHYERYARERAG